MTTSGERRVLVTGATGLIGRSVVPALTTAGWTVVASSRSSSVADVLACDLSDRSACDDLLRQSDPSAIVHLAGGASADLEEMYRSSVLGTVHLLEACAVFRNPPYVVSFGSAAEYGDQPSPIAETAPQQPLSDYGRVKAAQTTIASAIARRSGVRLTVVRPFNIVARDLPHSTALGNARRQLCASSDTASQLVCGRTDVVRDYVPIDFVVDVVAALLAAPRPGTVVNVCSGFGLVLGDILRAMIDRSGRRVELVTGQELAALPAPRRSVGDPSLLHSLLGLRASVSAASLAQLLVP